VVLLPETRLPKNNGESCLSTIDRASEAAEEPFHPGRHVHRALLRALEDVVVVVPLASDLRGHAVEPLRAVLRSRQSEIGNCTREAAVAIVERMDCDEPEMREAGLQYVISDKANLDGGAMWPTAFALKALTAADEVRIGALVKKAVS